MYDTAPRKLSTPRKLMLLIISIFFVFMIGSNVLLNISTSRLAKETVNSLKIQYENTLYSLADNFTRIYSLSLNLLNDQDLNNLAKLSNALNLKTKLDSILRLQEKLTIIKNSNSLIYNIKIFLPQHGISINADGYQGGSITRYSQDELDAEIALVKSWSGILEAYEDKLYVPVTSLNLSTGKIYCAIIAELSNDSITQQLQSVISTGEVQYIFETLHGSFSLESIEHSNRGEMDLFMRENVKNTPVTLSMNKTEYLLFLIEDDTEHVRLHIALSSTPLMMPMRVLSVTAYALIGLIIVSGGIYIFMDYTLVDKPLRTLVAAFRSVESDLDTRLPERASDEFGYLFMCFNNMTNHLKLLVDKTYKQQLLIKRAELKQLEEQTNPHFLYNSYFMLHRLVKSGDYEKSVRFSHEMGKYLRYITRSGRDFVELWEENEHARTYTEIQILRFAERIRAEYDELPDIYRHIKTPRLMLQPLIENSFIHGLENKESDGIIKVSFGGKDGFVIISVEDNGEELTDESLNALRLSLEEPYKDAGSGEEVTAIMNINRRIRLLFGNDFMLHVSRSALGGLKTEVLLPWEDPDV